jgi:hypothetical protein
MGQTGFTVLVNRLFGDGRGREVFTSAIGKTIKEVSLVNDGLHFTFEDGYRMRIFDDGQSCCEIRYMRTDDDLSYFVGAKLTGAEIKDAPNVPDEYGEHEVQFLEIQTDRGVFTISNHNEHNGYYDGFWLRAEAVVE